MSIDIVKNNTLLITFLSIQICHEVIYLIKTLTEIILLIFFTDDHCDGNIPEATPSNTVVPSKAGNSASSITDFNDSLGKLDYHITYFNKHS